MVQLQDPISKAYILLTYSDYSYQPRSTFQLQEQTSEHGIWLDLCCRSGISASMLILALRGPGQYSTRVSEARLRTLITTSEGYFNFVALSEQCLPLSTAMT